MDIQCSAYHPAPRWAGFLFACKEPCFAAWYAQVVPDRSRKRPRDPNELARRLVSEATGEEPKYDPYEGKDPAAVALGRKGGLKGGKARAVKMTPKERSEAAKRAAEARWGRPRS